MREKVAGPREVASERGGAYGGGKKAVGVQSGGTSCLLIKRCLCRGRDFTDQTRIKMHRLGGGGVRVVRSFVVKRELFE